MTADEILAELRASEHRIEELIGLRFNAVDSRLTRIERKQDVANGRVRKLEIWRIKAEAVADALRENGKKMAVSRNQWIGIGTLLTSAVIAAASVGGLIGQWASHL